MEKVFLLLLACMPLSLCSVSIHMSVGDVINVQDPVVGFNFDWVPNSYGRGWNNMSCLLVNLTRLEYLTSQLAPSVLRIGGGDSDLAVYDVGSKIPVVPYKNQNFTCPGTYCLTMKRWDEIHAFCRNAGCRTAFGLNAMVGKGGLGPHINGSAPWDPSNAEALLKYTYEHNYSSTVYGWELGNELENYMKPEQQAAEFFTLKGIIDSLTPEGQRPYLLGPDIHTEASWLDGFLAAAHTIVDKATVHVYSGYGGDPKLPSKMLTNKFLDAEASNGRPIAEVVAKYPSVQAWVGETSAAWHSGQMNTTNAFISSIWYMNALGVLAQLNFTMQLRQTLVGGYYGLIADDYTPNPDYYTLLLWVRLMGTKVLSTTHPPESDDVRYYAQCMKGSSTGAIVVAALNINTNSSATLYSPPNTGKTRDMYILTATSPRSRTMMLNGQPLMYDEKERKLPTINPETQNNADPISLPPVSISYIAYPQATWKACM